MIKWINSQRSPILFIVITVAIGGWLTYVITRAEDKTALLPGKTTHGHYQVEMQCAACHTNEKKENLFTSSGVSNKSCLNCHGDALTKFSDSHPVRKFKNPENAVFLEEINAKSCVACHREHNEKLNGEMEMGVTIASDYCAHCHQVTLDNLESHKNLAFNSCATAGCHNYHDNMALSPSFLLKHFGEPDILAEPVVSQVEALNRWLEEGNKERAPLVPTQADAPKAHSSDKEIHLAWHESSHAAAGINCSDCHGGPSEKDWIAKPTHTSCQGCHEAEVFDFTQGKHGMRLAHEGLSPMTPGMARQTMKADAIHKNVSCSSCHDPHGPNRQFAAAEACITCHDDTHTQNYKNSAHSRLWEAEISGAAPPGSGVSCATCHMPREKRNGQDIVVNHDQTANLTPNEKMLRNVCNNCHGLQFSLDALADRSLIDSNFTSRSPLRHPGIDWVVEKEVKRDNKEIIELMKSLKTLSPSDSSGTKTRQYQQNQQNEK